MARFEVHSSTGGRPGQYRAFERGPLVDIVGWGIALFAFLLVSGAVLIGLVIATVLRLAGWLFLFFIRPPRHASVDPSHASPQPSFHQEEIIEGEFRVISDNSNTEAPSSQDPKPQTLTCIARLSYLG